MFNSFSSFPYVDVCFFPFDKKDIRAKKPGSNILKDMNYLQAFLCLAVAVGSAPITDNELQTRLVAIKDVRLG